MGAATRVSEECRLIVIKWAQLAVADHWGELRSRGETLSMASEPPSGADVPAPGDIPAATGNDRVKDDQVRERAYLIWVDEGMPHGRELDHWLRAKWELQREPNP
jgi:hypothetical protein